MSFRDLTTRADAALKANHADKPKKELAPEEPDVGPEKPKPKSQSS